MLLDIKAKDILNDKLQDNSNYLYRLEQKVKMLEDRVTTLERKLTAVDFDPTKTRRREV